MNYFNSIQETFGLRSFSFELINELYLSKVYITECTSTLMALNNIVLKNIYKTDLSFKLWIIVKQRVVIDSSNWVRVLNAQVTFKFVRSSAMAYF